MVLKTIRRTLAGLVLMGGAVGAVHAQTVASPPLAACTTIDRSEVGQYAWGLALRWGTPDLLDRLVRQHCIDPNAWQQMAVDEAPMIDQVRNTALLSKAVSLGWKPVDQVLLDRQRNPYYVNPLLTKMVRARVPDEEALTMFRQAQAQYGFAVTMSDKPSTPTEREDLLVAIARMLPIQLLNENDSRTGLTPLVAAAAAKYDRLVVALMNAGAHWQTPYAPMGGRPLRGVWDAAFDNDNCLLKYRTDNDTPLSALDIENRQDRSIAALRSVWTPSNITSPSTKVMGLTLNMVTAQALWLKPADWTILQTGLPASQVSAANTQAEQIKAYQQSQHREWSYSALIGTAVPPTVCETLRER